MDIVLGDPVIRRTYRMVGPRRSPRDGGFSQRLRSGFTERNFLIGLTIMFVVMTLWVVTVPYDPMKGDIADATTNAIWTEYYKEGKFAVTYDQWKADGRPDTQSVVVMLGGTPYVVNEKGPAHAIFAMVLGPATGTVFAAIATFATYMLGRRIFNWKVGAIASLMVLTNLTVVTMWYKDYWVDASTMHLLILSIWLFVESGLRMRAYLEKRQRRSLFSSVVTGLGGGVAFGASIATRYTVAIVIVPAVVYVFVIFGKTLAHYLKRKDIKAVGRTFVHMTVYFLPFLLGLLIVLVPLMSYNNTYFGGPFRSGYDATTLMDYARSKGQLEPRNQTDYITSDPVAKVGIVVHNTIVLAPVVLLRMLCLIFVPVAIWKLWKRPIFWLLLLWGLFIMIGFYSMDWVDKYATIPMTPWEPRYQMPALPPFALLGGYGIYTVGKYIEKKTDGKGKGMTGPVFVVLVIMMMMFTNLGPVEGYFHQVHAGMNPGMPNNGVPPGNTIKPVIITIRDVYPGGQRFVGKLIKIDGCNVIAVHIGPNGQAVGFDMTDPSGPNNLTVAFIDFPPGTAPTVHVGNKVSVTGMFQWQDRNNNGAVDLGEPVLTVKNGTADKVIVKP
jgi:hypothetical protein